MGKRWIAVTKCTSLNLKNFKKPSHQNHPTKPPQILKNDVENLDRCSFRHLRMRRPR